MPYATLRRWRDRWRRGRAIFQTPGPRKVPGLDLGQLGARIRDLAHRRRRTRGSGPLYREHRDHLSRRHLDDLVREERDRQNHERHERLPYLTWTRPNLAWAIDATVLRRTAREPAPIAVLVRDLASHYHFEPLLLPAECAEANLDWLGALLERHGAPLLLKRDNGNPFNAQAIDDLLGERVILPLNSPAYWPRYNGAIEHGIGSFKRALLGSLDPGKPVPEIDRLRPLVQAVVHLHNARPRRSLGGLSPAQAYHLHPPMRPSRRQRHRIFESISAHAAEILRAKPEPLAQHDLAAAWRSAVLAWLRRQHLIECSKTQNRHPLYPCFFTH